MDKKTDKKEPNSYEHRVLEAEYQKRFTYLKTARNAGDENGHEKAFANYSKFLKIMADVNGCDIFSIQPDHFTGPTKLSEKLVISQVYFEMAKYYSVSPNFNKELENCLDQFIKFTINEPYQVLNSETLRKYLKKAHIKNGRDHFEQSLRSIYIKSKKCFIATHLFGPIHPVTQDLRAFKAKLLKHSIGLSFISNYYHYSPKVIAFFDVLPRPIYLLLLTVLRPCLYIFAKLFA